jgi:hypothetical protein
MKISVKIPESQKEITLGQYQKFISIHNASKDKEGGDLLIRQHMISIFCHVPMKAVLGIRRAEFNSIVMQIQKVLDQKGEFMQRLEIGGSEYGFIPNLDDMSYAEYADIDGYLKDWSDYHKAMSVLYRPIVKSKGGKYIIEDYSGTDAYKDVMKEAKLSDVNGMLLFFYRLSVQLLTITPKFFHHLVEKNPKMEEVLAKNGAGISTYTRLLQETSINLMMWQKPIYMKH